jgi:hypothetical protein
MNQTIATHRLHADVVERLKSQGRLILIEASAPWSEPELNACLRGADAMPEFMTDLVDRAMLARAPRLRIVACALKGSASADRLLGFGCGRLLGVDSVRERARVQRCDLAQALALADFVFLALPLTSGTPHLIDAQALARCKRGQVPGFGDPNSTSGTVIPGYCAFAKNKIDRLKDFKRVLRANRETPLLAVVNQQVDVATNNTEHWDRFAQPHAKQVEPVREIWRSPLITLSGAGSSGVGCKPTAPAARAAPAAACRAREPRRSRTPHRFSASTTSCRGMPGCR